MGTHWIKISCLGLTILGILLLHSCSNYTTPSSSTSHSKTTERYVGGIQINEPDQKLWAQTLKKQGLNLAQVTVYAKQGIWNSDHLWWHNGGPTYEDTTNLIREIRALKSENLNVIMVLRVALQHEFEENHYKWHGMILPKTKKQRAEWFYRYNYWVEMWSQICEREGVEVLAIGSELNALSATTPVSETPPSLEYFSNRSKQLTHEKRVLKHKALLENVDIWEYGEKLGDNLEKNILEKIESNLSWSEEVAHSDQTNALELINRDRQYLDSCWRGIISNARQHYKGKLTFAANFDSYHELGFWDDLDFIGINAYFPLRKIQPEPIDDKTLKAELIDGWEATFEQINQFKEQEQINHLPIFFTEIGYTRKENCTTAPWKGHGYSLVTNGLYDTLLVWPTAPEKPQERIYAIQALNQVIRKNNYPLEGISYWKLTSYPQHLDIEPFALSIDSTSQDQLIDALKELRE